MLGYRSNLLAAPLLISLIGLVGCGGSTALPTAAIEHNLRGAELLGGGSLDDAEARFRLALEYHPRFAEAHANLGVVALARHDLDAAERHLRSALTLNPDFDEAWSNLGVVLSRQGDQDAAAEAYRRALSIDPGHVGARRNLAELHMRRGDFASARAHLYRLVQLQPGAEGARAEGLLAYCALRLGRPSAARERAAASLAERPGDPWASFVRGVLRAQQGDSLRALADLEAAAEEPLLRAHVELRVPGILIALGRLRLAAPRVEALLQQRGDEAAVQLLAAALALGAEAPEAARDHARLALRAAPDSEAASHLLAQACEQTLCE